MKPKKIIGVCAAAALSVTSMLPLTATAVDSSTVITPNYAASIKIVDENGNSLTGANAEIKDSHGNVVAEWIVGLKPTLKDGYVYDPSLYPQLIDFASYVDGKPFGDPPAENFKAPNGGFGSSVSNKDTNNSDSYYFAASAGKEYTGEIAYIPSSETVDLVLPAGQYATYVDSGYAAKKSFDARLEVHDDKKTVEIRYCDSAARTSFGDGISIGKHEIMNLIGGSGVGHESNSITISDKATEYTKVKMNIKDFNNRIFNSDGTYTSDSKVTTNFQDEDKGICGIFLIVSGGVVSAVIPDSNGDFDFYVERSSRQALALVQTKTNNTHTRGDNWNFQSVSKQKIDISTAAAPKDATNLIFKCDDAYKDHFDSTKFTLSVTSVPEGYKKPADLMFTLSDSEGYLPVEATVAKETISDSSSESQPDSSSESQAESSESIAESSSLADSQADESSEAEVSSVADTSSTTESESSTASVTESSSTVKTDSSSKAVSAKTAANPNTGAAAGGAAVLALMIGAGVVAAKKKK